MSKYVIFNADDFGASPSVNRGIVKAHVEGVVTSTSLMVTGASAREASALAARHPTLSLGLHWVGEPPEVPELDTGDERAVAEELERQLELFGELVGCPPTHMDSHHHLHREEHLLPTFRAASERLRVPLRGDGPVHYIGGFYAQWEWKVSNPDYVSVEFLEKLLREEVPEGWTEISCHPGFVGEGLDSVYSYEREFELRTLTDRRLGKALDDLDIALRSYRDWAQATS